ncbi:MAG TPA: CvpA family protein [Anaerolineae bacterium]|nr:CvpA family protein [Anaerolineae bacterium]HQK14219.1 CvpA family protein [Anaerolineae bacterium]
MVPIQTVFFGLMLLFGIIGALRGWAKELLVTFSVILARFIETVLLKYVPVISTTLQTMMANDPKTWFYVRSIIFIITVAFGYATTIMSSHLGAKARKEKLQDTLLGFFLGGINGFLVIGMLWGFLHVLGYNLWGITAPQQPQALALIGYLPLGWLEGPTLLIAVAIAFAFILIVFV